MDGRGGPQERERDADEQVVGLEEKHVHPIQSLFLSSYLCESIDSSAPNTITTPSLQAMSSLACVIQGWVGLPLPSQDESFLSFPQVLLFTSQPLVSPEESSLVLFSYISTFSLCTVISMLLESPVTCQLVSLPKSPLLRSLLLTKPFYALMHHCKIDTFQEF